MKDDLSAPLLPEEGCARRARGGGSRIRIHDSRITIPRAALLAAALACAGCGPRPVVLEGRYVTYEHAFTDAAEESVRQGAGRLCGQRGQVAVRASRACSLTQCTTSYQCMSEADAQRLAGEKK